MGGLFSGLSVFFLLGGGGGGGGGGGLLSEFSCSLLEYFTRIQYAILKNVALSAWYSMRNVLCSRRSNVRVAVPETVYQTSQNRTH